MSISNFIILLSFIIFFNITLLYLDDFNLSNNKYIKISQIISPLLIILLLILIYYESISNVNNLIFVDNPNKNPNISIGAKVEVSKEAGHEISKGISNIGYNIGLAGTISAVTAATAKVVGKSSLPPVQKAGIVIAGAAAGGAIHVASSAINKLNSNKNIPDSSTESITTVNKFIADSANTPLNDLIFGIEILNYACLSLIIYLFFIILFKFFLNEDKINLNLSSLIGEKLNKSLNYYLIKIIKLNKKTSTIYIFIIFIILFISLSFNSYFITELSNNLDNYINFHINLKKNN